MAITTDNTASLGNNTNAKGVSEQKAKESFSKPIKKGEEPWFSKNMIEIISIVAGILVIIWQNGRQHRSSLQVQKENFKEKLRLEIYQELIKSVDNTSSKLSKQSSKSMDIPISLETYSSQVASGIRPVPPRARASQFSAEHHSLHGSIARLFYIFERYTIAVPKFKIFQTALNVAIYDSNQAYEPLYYKLLDFLPIDIQESDRKPGGPSVIAPKVATKEDLSHIQELCNKYNEALTDIVCYLYDLTAESQNILLGSLFDNRVPSRKPLDQNHIVITTDEKSINKLERYFNEETAWGKNQKEIEEDVLSSLSSSQAN
ncbi:MAG TPA: hypothetical protein ENH01_01690 [Nitrospirae bacterium]|nr:hypothetical protein [Nitrospirota bacterium]